MNHAIGEHDHVLQAQVIGAAGEGRVLDDPLFQALSDDGLLEPTLEHLPSADDLGFTLSADGDALDCELAYLHVAEAEAGQQFNAS